MPDAPAVSAPAAAPSAPAAAPAAVSAPAAAPVVTEVPAAAPAPVEGAPAAQPAAAVEVPALPAGLGTEPKQSDFEGDVVGFLDAHNAWERQRDGIEDIPAADAKPADAEVKPADAEVKPDAEADDKPWAPAPEATITPEALNALAAKSPELQAAMEASPEVKNALFSMARINAKAAPILEIYPNVESAKFAAETSGRFVNHKLGFLEALDNPESFPAAYEQFASEFIETDKDGKPVMDAQGNPVYGQDFQMLNDHIVDTYHSVEVADLEAQLAAGQFASDDERESADMALQAFKFIAEWKKGQGQEKKPDLSKLDPQTRAYYEAKEKEIADREAALGGKEKAQTSQQRAAEKTAFNADVIKTVGGSVGKRLGDMIAEKEKTGVFIPAYVTAAKDPETGISIFAKTLLDKFEEATYGRVDRATGKVIGGVAFIRNQAKMLALRPPSPEAKKARVDFANQLIDNHLPAIFDAELRQIQNNEIADRGRRSGKAAVREQMAEREVRAGGGAPTPKAVDAPAAMKQAYEWVDQTFPDLDPQSRTEKALIKKNELMGARY